MTNLSVNNTKKIWQKGETIHCNDADTIKRLVYRFIHMCL